MTAYGPGICEVYQRCEGGDVWYWQQNGEYWTYPWDDIVPLVYKMSWGSVPPSARAWFTESGYFSFKAGEQDPDRFFTVGHVRRLELPV